MSKSAFVRVRVEPALKDAAEEILNELGITPSQAVTMLYKQIANQHAWPTKLRTLNAETSKTLDETDQGIGLRECKNIEDLFTKLGI